MANEPAALPLNSDFICQGLQTWTRLVTSGDGFWLGFHGGFQKRTVLAPKRDDLRVNPLWVPMLFLDPFMVCSMFHDPFSP